MNRLLYIKAYVYKKYESFDEIKKHCILKYTYNRFFQLSDKEEQLKFDIDKVVDNMNYDEEFKKYLQF